MLVLARAPFLPVLTGLVVMLALYERTALSVLPLVALLAALGVTASSYGELGELKGQWRAVAAVSVCVIVSSLWMVFSLRNSAAPVPPSIDTVGVVTESRPWGFSYAVAVDTPQGGFLLRLPPDALVEGDAIWLTGNTEPLRSAASNSDFREDRYWAARGVTAQLSPFETGPADESGVPVLNVHRWRYTLHLFLVMNMPRLTGAYLNAAWTGKHDAMLDGAHRKWGTSHILAVSGFHVGVMMAGASLMFKRGAWRVPLLSLILWFYVFLTGANASAVRAGLMIQAGLAGELAGRPGSSINSVSLAAVLLLLRSPFWFWDVGWRLSVLAALAIAAAYERWGTFGWRTWLFMNAMIWFATFPQVSRTFGGAPLTGILINLLAPQFFGIALSAASIAAALFWVGLPGASLLLMGAESLFNLWGTAAGAVTGMLPWQLPWSPVISFCCAALFILLTCRAFFVPWRSVIILSPMGALAAFFLFAA